MRTRASTATQPVGQREHRVEVELRDRGEAPRRARPSRWSTIGERRSIGRGRAAEARDEPAGLPAVTSSLGVDVGQRRDPERRLADQLGEDAARPEGDERAEDGVLDDAGEQLGAALQHRLDDHGRPIRSAAARTPPRRRDRARSPPSSVLCAPGAAVFTTTGKPSSSAARRGLVRSRGERAPARAGPVGEQELALSAGSSQASSAPVERRGDDRLGALRSIPSGAGTVPCGRRSHSARSAARPSARAADSG